MTEVDVALWKRVNEFSLDDPTASFSFTQRLASENHWSLPFATRVVEEYKRFMFLAVTCDHIVSPSDEVDQVWHLHLVYTRSYWDEFCGEVLCQPVHHGPTKGGKAESEKFVELYELTKASYLEKFGCEPPLDIWPESKIRFDRSNKKKLVSTRKFLLIRKPDFSKLASADSVPLFAAAVPLSLVAWSPFSLDGPTFLIFYAVLAIVVGFSAIGLQRLLLEDGRDEWAMQQSRMKLSLNHVAFLAGNENGLLQAAVCELLVGGQAKSLRQQLRYENSRSKDKLTSVARRILKKLENNSSLNLGDIVETTRVPIAKISADLAQAGLIQTKVKRHVLYWTSGLMMASVLGLGVARIVQAIGNQRPFGFLVIEMLLLIWGSIVVVGCVPWRTKAGEEVFKKHRDAAQRIRDTKIQDNLSAKEVGFVLGFLGSNSLAGTAYSSFSSDTNRIVSDPIVVRSGNGSGSSGCGGGCGGGGGGGGCGGCGG